MNETEDKITKKTLKRTKNEVEVKGSDKNERNAKVNVTKKCQRKLIIHDVICNANIYDFFEID